MSMRPLSTSSLSVVPKFSLRCSTISGWRARTVFSNGSASADAAVPGASPTDTWPDSTRPEF